MNMKFQPAENPIPNAQTVLLETNNHNHFTTKTNPAIKQPSNRLSVLGKLLIVASLTIIGTTIGIIYWYSDQFKQASGVKLTSVVSAVRPAMKDDPFSSSDTINILIAGLDEVQNRRDGTMLTDTLILISIHRQSTITLLSIPRDLWINSLQTKVNALYYYGEESQDTTGKGLMRKVIGDITGLNIDYITLVNLETVKQIIDALGGIDIHVARNFTDAQFPKDDVDLTVKDPNVLYETISFNIGPNHFDGTTTLKFMRSRHSTDEFEGSDEGRRSRQQLVITSLIDSLKKTSTWLRPQTAGRLYAIWLSDFETDIPLVDLIAILTHMPSTRLSLRSVQIPIVTDDSSGILVVNKNNHFSQWVYEPVDPTWNELKTFINQQLTL